MSTYAAEIESAAQDIADAGAPVTFTRGTGAYNDATGAIASGATTAAADAIRVKGSATQFASLNLVMRSPRTLLVAASKLGTFVPEPDDKMTFAGVTDTVAYVESVAPDGVPILYRVTASK